MVQLPDSGGSAHLWIVLTDPFPPNSETVIVSVTTLRRGVDQTVVLQRGDHPFIAHQSAVFYTDSRVLKADWIASSIECGQAQARERCSPETLALVKAGVFASDFTSEKMIRLCRQLF